MPNKINTRKANDGVNALGCLNRLAASTKEKNNENFHGTIGPGDCN